MGSFRSSSLRIARMVSGEALRPARSFAGSAEGKTLKIMKTTALTMKSIAMPQSTRRTM